MTAAGYATPGSKVTASEPRDLVLRNEFSRRSKLCGATAKFGATVTLIGEDAGEKRTRQIEPEPEPDASERKISVTSPLRLLSP